MRIAQATQLFKVFYFHLKSNWLIISDTACVKFEIEIETDSDISEEHMKTATTFGIEPSDLPRIDSKRYAIAFMKRLLLHSEKIDKNLLEAHLNPVIATLWKEMLSSLEDADLKLINIQSGSLILTLFCPTYSSLQQLQDEKWRIKLQVQVEKLLKALGTYVKIKCSFKTRDSIFSFGGEFISSLRQQLNKIEGRNITDFKQYNECILFFLREKNFLN